MVWEHPDFQEGSRSSGGWGGRLDGGWVRAGGCSSGRLQAESRATPSLTRCTSCVQSPRRLLQTWVVPEPGGGAGFTRRLCRLKALTSHPACQVLRTAGLTLGPRNRDSISAKPRTSLRPAGADRGFRRSLERAVIRPKAGGGQDQGQGVLPPDWARPLALHLHILLAEPQSPTSPSSGALAACCSRRRVWEKETCFGCSPSLWSEEGLAFGLRPA